VQTMTSDELQALPDVTPRIDMREEIRDGKRVLTPVAQIGKALFQKDDDGAFMDAAGTRWMVGWLNGVRVRQQMR
jgi:hypothetical protein